MRRLPGFILAGALLSAAPAGTVTGTWNMGLQGDHVIPVALVLEQDGTRVTGTIAMPTHRAGERVEVRLSGQFEESELKVSGTMERANDAIVIDINARFNHDAALEGTLSMRGRSLPFTAERLAERK